MRTVRFCVLGLIALAPQMALADEEVDSPPRPEGIHGGQPVPTCAWPQVVWVGNCTATLVHPEVIIYAAHCGNRSSARFGETSSGAFTAGFEFCRTNPAYAQTNDQADDWAICKLNQPVDLPLTPIMFGCETDMLEIGLPVSLVGYGASSDSGGTGLKRSAETFINAFDDGVIHVGGNGVGSCPGDSGGPLMVELEDGSWRTIAITSTYQGICGGTNTYGRADKALPWFESVVNIDLTPCHDSTTGEWDPGPDCTGFYAGGHNGSGTWNNSCAGTPVSGPSDSCGPPYGFEDEDPPTVAIASPGDGERFDPAPSVVDVLVDADDGSGSGVGSVWLEINGTELPAEADENPPWEFIGGSYPKGVYTIVAIAEDEIGNQARSAPVTIGVGEDPGAGDDGTGGGDSASGTDGGGDGADGGADGGSGGSADGGTSGADDGLGEGSGSDTGLTGGEDDGGGCGCSTRPSPRLGAAILVLFVLARRRRTSAA